MNEELTKILQKLNKQVKMLEAVHHRVSSLEAYYTSTTDELNISQLMVRINAVQSLVDKIEIEVDNLEMRVSAIEHMGFRFRTSGL